MDEDYTQALPYQNLSLEDMEGEVWKDVPNYEGLYQISNRGRVKSIRTNKIRRLVDNGHGYYSVQIRNKHFYIHRLVALAFINNLLPDVQDCVNHKDGNKANCDVSNLEWCYHAENIQHAVANDLARKREVHKYDKNGIYVTSYKSMTSAAKEANVGVSSIANNCAGLSHFIKGFAYRYERADKIEIPKRKYKKILQLALDGTLIKEWESVQRIQEELGIKKNNVVCNCLGRVCTCSGYIFKYK